MVSSESSECIPRIWLTRRSLNHDSSLDVKYETSAIILNAAGLELGVASVYSDALQADQTQISCELNPTTERVSLSLPIPLPAGSTAQLQIGFQAKLTGSMMGYYKSAWEHEGQARHYALTQFEVSLTLQARNRHCLTHDSIRRRLPDEHSLAGTSQHSKPRLQSR